MVTFLNVLKVSTGIHGEENSLTVRQLQPRGWLPTSSSHIPRKHPHREYSHLSLPPDSSRSQHEPPPPLWVGLALKRSSLLWRTFLCEEAPGSPHPLKTSMNLLSVWAAAVFLSLFSQVRLLWITWNIHSILHQNILHISTSPAFLIFTERR